MSKKYFILIVFLLLFLSNNVFALTPGFTDPLHPTSGGGMSGFEDLLVRILSWLWPISIVVAVLMLIIGAYYFVFSGGNPAKVATAKKVIIYALVGLAIVGLAMGIWNVIKTILGI